jgi:hypothetical protein
MSVTAKDASGNSVNVTVPSVFAQMQNVFLGGLNQYTGLTYTGGGCPRRPQLTAIGSLK